MAKISAQRYISNMHGKTMRAATFFTAVLIFMFTVAAEAAAITRGDEIIQLKSKKDGSSKLYGYENTGDKYNWWAEAHYLGAGKDQLNQGYETQWVIAPQYDKVAKEFSEGLAAVEINGKVGFIDRMNRFIIPPIFEPMDDLAGFKYGLAAVKKNGKYGYIDKEGHFVFPPVFDDAENFGNDYMAAVKIGKNFGCIDLLGDTVVPFEYPAKAIMTTVPVKNKPYREAKKLTKQRWEQCYYSDFLEDVTETANKINRQINDINYMAPTGDFALGGSSSVGDGFYIVANSSGAVGVIDSYGRYVIPCSYKSVRYDTTQRVFVVEATSSPFNDDRPAVGIANMAGGLIIPPVLESIGDFNSEGVAPASIGEHSGYINVLGLVNEEFLQALLESSVKEKGTYYTKRLIGVLPTCAPAHNCLGIYYASECDNLKDAIHHFTVAHNLAPDNEDFKANMKAAKSERNSRRWNRVLTGMSIAAAVLSVGAVTYSAVKGVPMQSSNFSSGTGGFSSSNDYSSGFSDSSSRSSSSSASSSAQSGPKGVSMADAASIKALQRSYDNYESMVVDCNVNPEKHQPGDKREYQSKMRDIRKKLKERYGIERSQSPHETN